MKSLRQALDDPQTLHNGMVIEGDEGVCATDRMRLVGSPIRMSAAPAAVRRPPPKLGEHTAEILAEAGDLAAVAVTAGP